MFIAFIVGNILYYIVGIILAFLFKDNRASCHDLSETYELFLCSQG